MGVGDFGEAFDKCEKEGGYLPSPANEKENNLIFKFLSSSKLETAWIGIKRIHNDFFLPDTGAALTYVNWEHRKPKESTHVYLQGDSPDLCASNTGVRPMPGRPLIGRPGMPCSPNKFFPPTKIGIFRNTYLWHESIPTEKRSYVCAASPLNITREALDAREDTNCPSGFEFARDSLLNYCVKYVKQPKTFGAAWTHCVKLNAIIPCPKSKMENEHLGEYLSIKDHDQYPYQFDLNKQSWLGFIQNGNTYKCKVPKNNKIKLPANPNLPENPAFYGFKDPYPIVEYTDKVNKGEKIDFQNGKRITPDEKEIDIDLFVINVIMGTVYYKNYSMGLKYMGILRP